jgi:alpha-N-arabinofuranosidase
VWYRARGGEAEKGHWREAPPLLEEVYNLEDALVCAQYLGAFVRRADVVKVACIAQIVNVIAPILTRREGLLIQSIYHPFALFSQNARGISLTPIVKSPLYRAGERGEVPVIDASATFDESGEIAAFIVNRDASAAISVDIRLGSRRATKVIDVQLMGGADPKAANTWEEPNRVFTTAGTAAILADGGVRMHLPAPGFGMVRVKTDP